MDATRGIDIMNILYKEYKKLCYMCDGTGMQLSEDKTTTLCSICKGNGFIECEE